MKQPQNLGGDLPEVSIPKPTPDVYYNNLNSSSPSVLAYKNREDLDSILKYLS